MSKYSKRSFRFRLFLPLMLLLSTSGIASGATWSWSANNPSSAVVNSLSFNAYSTASAPNTYILAGTNGGGIFRKTGTGSWSRVNTAPPSNAIVTTVVPGPLNVFAGTSDSGLYRSTDDTGSAWNPVAGLPPNSNVTGVVVHGTKLYAGIYGRGVYKSNDNGATWTASNGSGGTALGNVDIRSLAAFWSGTAWKILAGTAGGGLYYSTNDGSDWAQAGVVPAGATIASIALTSDPLVIYAATRGSGVYQSGDGGATWSGCGNVGLPAGVNFVIARSLTSLLAGTDSGLYLSTNSGANWSLPTVGVGSTSVNSIAIDPQAPALMFAGTSSGVFTSSDGGLQWTAATAGLNYDTDIRATAVDPGNPTIIYAGGSGSGAFKSTDSGATWSIANSGLGNATVNALLAKGTNVYAGTSNGVFKSINGAASWTSIVNGALPVGDVKALTSYSSTLYAGCGNGVYTTGEGAINWTATGALGIADVTSLAVTASGHVYAGTSGSGVYRTTDAGINWQQITDGFGGSTTVNSMAINATAGIYAGTTSGLFKWDDVSRWDSVSNSFTSADIQSLAARSGASDSQVFAGTLNGGLYLSSDAGTSWIAITAGLPSPIPAIQSITAASGSPIKVYAGLAGRGVARLNVAPELSVTSPPATNPVASLDFGTVFKDSSTIKTLQLKNTGALPLSVTAINMVGAGFSVAPGGAAPCSDPSAFTLSPEQSCTLDVTFQPSTTGSKSGTLSIASNSITSPTTNISLAGAAVALSATIASPPPTPPAAFPCVYGSPISISGTASATGALLQKVQVSTNGVDWTDVGISSPWTYSWTPTGDGTYTIRARVVADSPVPVDKSIPDCSAVDGTKGCLKVIVNNVLPVSAITFPVTGAKLQGGVRTITGTATDAGAGIQKVEISTDGGASWAAVSGTTSWVYDWTPPSSNTYIIKTRATDNDNKAEPEPYPSVTFVVDSIAPSSTITDPLNNAVKNGTSYTISGTATDTGGSGLANTQVYIDGTPHTVTGGLWSYPWVIPAGTYKTFTIYTQAADQAGNQETVVPAAALHVTVDNISPTSSINAPPTYIAGTVYTLTGTSTDIGVGISKVQISVNDGAWVDVSSGTTAWTYNWPVGADGTYTFRSRAIDAAGNEETPGIGKSTIVNNGTPLVAITSPADNSATKVTNVTITGTASDAGAGINTVDVSIDGGAWAPAVYNASNGTWSYAWAIPLPPQEKPYLIKAKATDKEGVSTTTSTTTIVYDVTPPESAIVNPANGGNVNGPSFTIQGTAFDPFSPVADGSGVSAVQVSFDGGKSWYPASTSDNWETWTFEWRLPRTEQHPVIMFRAQDKAGNMQTASSTQVNVYQVPPTSEITVPAAGAHIRGTQFTITGKAADLGLGIQKVEISTDGGASWNTATGAESWSYNWQLPADGTYSVLSRATDLVGYVETSPVTASITVDNTLPDTSIASKPAFNSNTASPSFTFTANENSTFECSLDTEAFKPCTSPAAYGGLVEGSHSFAVRAIDLAGNVDPSPATHAWIVDTVKPQTIALAPSDKATRISVTSAVTAAFNEDIDPASVTAMTFTLDNGSKGTVTYDAATRTATFTATPRLGYATTYTATIGAGVKDIAGNPVEAVSWTFATDPDGDIDLNGVVDIADAVLCLKYSINGKTLTAEQLRHGNVAPLKNGKPYPNGKIDIGDAVVILERVVGLVSW